jgi:hypothetical protein
MSAGGDLMEKTLTEIAQLLKNRKAAAMRRDWETRLAEEPEYNSRMQKCAEFSKEAKPRMSQKRSQSWKSLNKNTSSQELPRALTSPNQMKQTREACRARSH